MIQNKRFKGNPGLVVTTPDATVQYCVFISFIGRKRIPIEDLILADGRWLGGLPPWK